VAGHVFGTGVDTMDAEMTTNQPVSQDIYNIIHPDQFIPQQVFPPAGLFAPYLSLEFSNQTQQAFQVVPDSSYLYDFEQHGELQSGFSTASGPLSGSMDLDSEFLAAGSLNQNFSKLQTSTNNSSPPFHGAFASVDS